MTTETYNAILAAANKASGEYNKAALDYRASKIGDEAFLAARRAHEVASAAFDSAYSQMQARA